MSEAPNGGPLRDGTGRAEAEPVLPPSLRLLKALVIVLTLSMIGGVITVVALLVTRMPHSFAPAPPARLPALPEGLRLPDGTAAEAVTFGAGWVVVVTRDGRLLVFDGAGRMVAEHPLGPAAAGAAP